MYLQKIKTIKWLGTLIVIFGICLTSFNIYPLNIYFGIVGSGLWAIAGYLQKDKPLFLVEIFAVLIYIIGLFNFFLK